MSINNLSEQLKKLPDNPGVYLFKKENKVLYVGKATSLRERVRSYFSDDLSKTRSPLVAKAVGEADKIDFEITDSALEALILEANLIRKYKPLGNTTQKDDKSYNYVVITREEFPRVFTVRGHDLSVKYDSDEFKYVFGPYTSGSLLRKALKLIRRIFPFRGEKDPVKRSSRHSPLNEQIGLVPNFAEIDKKEYQRLIRNLALFFEGKKKSLIKELEKQMKQEAKEEKFEQAIKTRNTIYALNHINDISLLTDEFVAGSSHLQGFVIEAYDIAHTMGENMVGVMIVSEDGHFRKDRYRKFNIKSYQKANDTGALREMLERRLTHDEWPLPNLFVVDGGKAQYNIYSKILENLGIKIPVVAVTKGERHQPTGFIGDEKIISEHELSILQANNEAHRFAINWHRNKQRKDRFVE